jgi:hypothetical protein
VFYPKIIAYFQRYFSYTKRWATYKKPTAQTGTFGFCQNAKPTLKNQKSLFFANARTE